jgi:hypothetical protein
MTNDNTKERHQFTVTLIALQNYLRPSEYTILRVTRESGGSSAGQRSEIPAVVPYELTPYSVVQCHSHVALISDRRSYSIYCTRNTSHNNTQFATLQTQHAV